MKSIQIKKNERYHLLIVAACFMLMFASYGACYNCLSIFVVDICEDIAISRQAFSGMYTAILLGLVASSLCVEELVKRIGLKKLMSAGAVGMSVSFVAFSRIHGPVGLYVTAFCIGFFLTAVSFQTVSLVVANWFTSSRGLMMGFVFMGSGLGGMLFIPIANHWITACGWRNAVLYLSGIMALLMCGLCFFVIKDHPSDAGLLPYGMEEGSVVADKLEEAAHLPMKILLKDPAYWLFQIFTVGISMLSYAGSTIVPHLRDIGYSADFAAMVQSINMAAMGITRVWVGYAADKRGINWANLFCLITSPLMLAGLLLAEMSGTAILLIVFGIGFSQAIVRVCQALLIRNLFDRHYYVQIYGQVNAVCNFVGAVTPLIYGALYTQTGGYTVSYYLFLCVYGVGAACFYAAKASIQRRRGKAC